MRFMMRLLWAGDPPGEFTISATACTLRVLKALVNCMHHSRSPHQSHDILCSVAGEGGTAAAQRTGFSIFCMLILPRPRAMAAIVPAARTTATRGLARPNNMVAGGVGGRERVGAATVG